jgi:hypothetical protein
MLTQDLCGELNYFKDYCEDGSMFKNTLSSLVNTISLIAKTLREPSSSPSAYRGGNLISKLE